MSVCACSKQGSQKCRNRTWEAQTSLAQTPGAHTYDSISMNRLISPLLFSTNNWFLRFGICWSPATSTQPTVPPLSNTTISLVDWFRPDTARTPELGRILHSCWHLFFNTNQFPSLYGVLRCHPHVARGLFYVEHSGLPITPDFSGQAKPPFLHQRLVIFSYFSCLKLPLLSYQHIRSTRFLVLLH